MNGEAPARVRVENANQQTLVLLLEDELILGRDCEGLLLNDRQVSRRHLRLRPVKGGVEVADLNTTNGSYLEGTILKQPQLIAKTSRILLGDTMVTVVFGAVTSSTERAGRTTDLRGGDDLRSTSIDMVAEMVSSGAVDVEPKLLEGDTVTVLFSDIESSTELAGAMGDEAWFALLEEHNNIIRQELVRFEGREIKSIGDGFMLVFPSVRKALRFAANVQRIVESDDGPDLRIRMGLHTGEAIIGSDGDLYGRHINLAARVANLAGGGQVVASLVVREIATGWNDAVFSDASVVELKGFADEQTVYEVDWTHESL